MNSPTAGFAKLYIEKHNLAIVKLPPGKKYPTHDGWNQPDGYFTDADEAHTFFTNRPTHGMGAVLGPSNLCSLDIDNLEESRIVFSEFGIDIDDLATKHPTVVGNPARFRIEFRVPAGYTLDTHKLEWADKTGSRSHVVFEMRAGPVQDVLPPTIHPDTGKPYTWKTKPTNGFLPLPDELLNIWRNWDVFVKNARALCPWAADAPTPPPRHIKPRQTTDLSVIDLYNQANSIHDALPRYGYTKQGKRYLSPHSSTKLAGCVMLDDNRVWIHHASDPLGGEHPVNPFDLFCFYEHNNDVAKATRAAAQELGIAHKTKSEIRLEPRVESRREFIDPETGEIHETPSASNSVVEASSIQVPAASNASALPTILDLPDLSANQKPLSTIRNLETVLQAINATVRYNVISKRIEILIPDRTYTQDNKENSAIAEIYSHCGKYKMPVGQIDMFLTNIADKNPHNPVANWITSKPWDGTSRLRALFNTVQSTDNTLRDILMRRWFISAVASAFSPNGVSSHGILVFQGAQYLGKTLWFKRLVPASLGVFQDGAILMPSDKDSVMNCVCNWIVELGEVDATFRKADIAQLKAFITRQFDRLRRPYARAESEFARRTVFCASVNDREFLSDPSGNRRFWTVEATAIDNNHDVDMQQFWAEMYEIFKSGETLYLTPDEMARLNHHNTEYELTDPIKESIISKYDWQSADINWEWKTATKILNECGFDRPTKADAARAGAVVCAVNGGRRKRTTNERLLLTPPIHKSWKQ
jgi:Virulence-associated protein E/Bifunctional DNA primase/polymerase, N-terminal